MPGDVQSDGETGAKSDQDGDEAGNSGAVGTEDAGTAGETSWEDGSGSQNDGDSDDWQTSNQLPGGGEASAEEAGGSASALPAGQSGEDLTDAAG